MTRGATLAAIVLASSSNKQPQERANLLHGAIVLTPSTVYLVAGIFAIMALFSMNATWRFVMPSTHVRDATMARRYRLGPLEAIGTGWRLALALVMAHPLLWLAICAIFLGAALLDYGNQAYLRLTTRHLAIAGLAWQTITAALLAAIAVRLHFIATNREAQASPLRLLLAAAALGVGLFALSLAIQYAYNWTIPHLSPAIAPLARSGARILPAAIFALFAFVRPALSLGLSNPVMAAFAALRRRPVAAVLWITALSLPTMAVGMSLDWAWATYGKAHPTGVYVAIRSVLTLFNTVNFTAFEIATVLMLNNLNTVSYRTA